MENIRRRIVGVMFPPSIFEDRCVDFRRSMCRLSNTVELVYSSHPSEAAKWLLYTGGLLIEVFNVYVAHGKFRWDFPY